MSSDESALDDDALVARLRAVASEADPVPPLVLDLARSAFDLRDLDAELAVLVLDSTMLAEPLAGVRGADDVRLLSYEAPAMGLELQVEVRDGRYRLNGQVVGVSAISVVVETDQRADPVQPDAIGLFSVAELVGNRIRVRVTTASGLLILTPWTVL